MHYVGLARHLIVSLRTAQLTDLGGPVRVQAAPRGLVLQGPPGTRPRGPSRFPITPVEDGSPPGAPVQEEHDEESDAFFLLRPRGLTHIRDVEGQLIADCWKRNGQLLSNLEQGKER